MSQPTVRRSNYSVTIRALKRPCLLRWEALASTEPRPSQPYEAGFSLFRLPERRADRPPGLRCLPEHIPDDGRNLPVMGLHHACGTGELVDRRTVLKIFALVVEHDVASQLLGH